MIASKTFFNGGFNDSDNRFSLAYAVVCWDQPGSGKSYFTGAIKNITVETYIQDGYALTNYLANRFGEEKTARGSTKAGNSRRE